MLVSLEYVHSKSILHRDIKPENLVFDDKGYLRLTDFGIARIWNPENSKETSGTPGYMAPEVMCRQNHGVAVDYFAVGIIAYECMMARVRLTLMTSEALCWQNQERHPRSYSVKAGANKARGHPVGVEHRSCRLHKQDDPEKAKQ